jgi:hypothetical protein
MVGGAIRISSEETKFGRVRLTSAASRRKKHDHSTPDRASGRGAYPVCQGIPQNGLIADLLCPRVPVGRQTDKYWIFGREGQQLTEQILRATGAGAQEHAPLALNRQLLSRSHALKRHRR